MKEKTKEVSNIESLSSFSNKELIMYDESFGSHIFGSALY